MLGLVTLLVTGADRDMIDGLMFGLVIGLARGFVGGFADKVKVAQASPNQGINLSLRNSWAPFLVTFLTVGVAYGIIHDLRTRLREGLTGGLIVALNVGSNRGGSAVIRHYALRLVLWFNGYTSFKFIKFLDQCAKLILLKKVGGATFSSTGCCWDYFADLPTIEKTGKFKRGRSRRHVSMALPRFYAGSLATS
jgi:hypothetical protein